VLTAEFIEEIRQMANNNLLGCGYFVSSGYIWEGKLLRHGLKNNKLAFYNKLMVAFTVIDDLDIVGMGEIEGHYQPIKKQGYENMYIGQVNNQILHYTYEDKDAWEVRHERYAIWESQMILQEAYPKDPVFWREWLKKITRKSCIRPYLMFLYSYFLSWGF
jgi:hypothetical protein